MRVRVLRDEQPDALHLAVAVDPELRVVPAAVLRDLSDGGGGTQTRSWIVR